MAVLCWFVMHDSDANISNSANWEVAMAGRLVGSNTLLMDTL